MPIREQLIRMTPVRFIAALLAVIFVTETGIMLVLPVMFPTYASRLFEANADAFLLVVILAPVLWWMLIHPLQSGMVSEQQRAVAIMYAAFHGIITIDETGSVESVNPEAERLFGYREEELLGKPVTLLMPERYRALHQAGMDRARSTATSPHQTRKIIEVEGLRKDGSESQLELSMVAWRSAGVRKYAGFVRDITARKRTEAELLRLRKAVEASGEVIFMTDSVGTITFVNPAFTELYGYEAREVVGRTTPRILKGGTMSPAEYQTLWKAITAKETVRREFVNSTKDGRLIHVEASLNPVVDDNGTITGFLAIQRDVTARRQAEFALRDREQRYRDVVQSIDEVVYMVETTGEPSGGRVVFVSDRAEHTTGYTPQEFLENPQLWSSLIHPDDLSSVASLTRQMFEERTAVTRRYRIRHRQTDSYRWVDDRVAPQIEPDGVQVTLFGVARDITETVLAEEAQARLVAILEATPDLVSIADPEGRLVYVNRAGRKMLGIDDSVDLTRYNLREFHDAVNATVVLTEGIPTALREGAWTGETELVALDGHAISVSQVILAHKAPNGTVTFLSTIARDITERKRVEETVRENDQRLQVALSNINIAVFHQDRALRYTWMYQPQLGYRPDQVVGRTDAELLPSEAASKVTEIKQRVLETGVRVQEEVRVVADSATLIFDLVAEPLRDASGEIIGLTGATLDITERKRAEESRRLQSAALHAAAEAIVITDREGAIEWVNPAFTQLTGYTAEEALGKNPRDLVKSGTHEQELYTDLWNTILAGRTWHGELINRRKDGSLYTEDQSVTPILDASGAITHFVAIKEDITKRLQLEAQFRQAQKMESVGQLASGIAHDFNNLLTVINGMSDLLLAQVSPDDPVHADVEEIHRAGARAATLTRQLLAFSRQQILEPRVLNINTVVTGMESLLRRLLGEDIDLVVVPAPDVGSVKADPGQIEQVITNLAVNARDAMPQGGQLTIESHNVEIDENYARQHSVAMPPGSYVRVVVSDSGVGIDEATRARIFDPFFTTKGPGKGTGLGLSTVYGIVKQSQGFIWVYSEVGHGTSFTILLPRVTEVAGTDRLEPAKVSSSGTETILLVEDNAGLHKLTTRFLEPAGYTVLGAATGEEALRLLERHEEPVHLLLSDVVLPGMSGRHLAEQLAQTHPGMKVLYMSGYTSDTIVRHGVLDAQVPFLNKPFTAAALLRKVREVLDS